METKATTAASSEYAWAEYLHCMEGTPDVDSLPISKPTAVSPVPGILLCLVLTVVSYWAAGLQVWPFLINGHATFEPVMVGIILGMLVGNCLPVAKSLHPGIKFSVKKLLPLGIIFLGARLDFQKIINLGAVGIAMSCLEVVLALILMLFLTRWLKLSGKLGTLLGIGTAICGGTAIVAAAPVIEAEEAEVVFGVATVTLLGLIGMFLLPVLGHWLALSDKAFGIWAGLAIHQLPQVVAAGFAYSQHAGEQATVVKLARICLLAPIVFIIGFIYARNKTKQHQAVHHGKINYWSMFPKFVLGFLALAFLRTKGWLPDVSVHFPDQVAATGTAAAADKSYSLPAIAQALSGYCIVMSMAGVGLETKFKAMKQTGLRPLVAATISALVIALVILGLIKFLKIT
ncbi:MAG TPA: YeiH family protein [Candidatus Acidoferrales bacterium]|nr:YeiH family protein [Candidatus Acidoferrales bacterium]